MIMAVKTCAIVLGGYINGYSIIRELHEKGVGDIILIDTSRSLGSFSNKISEYYIMKKDPLSLLHCLDSLHQTYDWIIPFPTNDLFLEYLYKIHEEIRNFCFLPFNEKNLRQSMDKNRQYAFCEKSGVPYPKTLPLKESGDLKKLGSLRLPLIIKPIKREDLNVQVFRNLQIYSDKDLQVALTKLEAYLTNGISFLASEIVPGEGSNIFAYVTYRNRDGKILNEWTGRKLSQFPNEFGVFASASNKASDEILKQGRILVEGMDLMGIVEPEFKYDARDGRYKLMEINLRSMMWHRAGNLSGVNLQYTQYLDAIGKKPEMQVQEKKKDIHFVYFQHEFYNLITRKGYARTFRKNLFESDETHYAVFTWSDLLPAIVDILSIPKKFKEKNV